MNKWKIPLWMENTIRNRDKMCVYCGKQFDFSKRNKKYLATWEHIVNDAKMISLENIVLCCFSCNASKGAKTLSNWFESDYCRKHGITKYNVAEIVKKHINRNI